MLLMLFWVEWSTHFIIFWWSCVGIHFVGWYRTAHMEHPKWQGYIDPGGHAICFQLSIKDEHVICGVDRGSNLHKISIEVPMQKMINGSINKAELVKTGWIRLQTAKFQIALANWFATLTLVDNVNNKLASEVIYECAKNYVPDYATPNTNMEHRWYLKLGDQCKSDTLLTMHNKGSTYLSNIFTITTDLALRKSPYHMETRGYNFYVEK